MRGDGKMLGWILTSIIVLIILWFALEHHTFVRLNKKINTSWSQLESQFKHKSEKITVLVELFKTYSKNEGVFDEVIKAQNDLIHKEFRDKALAHNNLNQKVQVLLSITKKYPKLESSKDFEKLKEELSNIESKIAYYTETYNEHVNRYNLEIKVFPGKIFASIYKFEKRAEFRHLEENIGPTMVEPKIDL